MKGAGAAEHCSYGDMCLRGCSCLCFPALRHTHCGVFFAVLFFSLGLPGRRHKQSECRTELHKHTNTQTFKTFNNGSLGSRIDEERSELRYVMRIAASVKHRIFERTLRPLAFQGACLSERRFPSQRELVVGGTRLANRRVSLKVWAERAALALAHCGDTHTYTWAGGIATGPGCALSKLGCCLASHHTFGGKRCGEVSESLCSTKFDLRSGRTTR